MAALDPCPACSAKACKVLESRLYPIGRQRTKTCLRCGHRWKTVEVPAEVARAIAKRKETGNGCA